MPLRHNSEKIEKMTRMSKYILTRREADAVSMNSVLREFTSRLESTIYFSMEKRGENVVLNIEYKDASKEKELADFLTSLRGYDFSYEKIDYDTIMAREMRINKEKEGGNH